MRKCRRGERRNKIWAWKVGCHEYLVLKSTLAFNLSLHCQVYCFTFLMPSFSTGPPPPCKLSCTSLFHSFPLSRFAFSSSHLPFLLFSPLPSPFLDSRSRSFIARVSLLSFLLHCISKLHSLFLRKSARPQMELLSWQPKGASAFHWAWLLLKGAVVQSRGHAKGWAEGMTWRGCWNRWGQGRCWAERGRDWREGLERETGEGEGETDSGLLPLLCGFLYTPSLPARLGKWVTEGRSSTQTLAKEHPATDRPENSSLLQSSLHLFQGGLYLYSLSLSPFKNFVPLTFTTNHPCWGFMSALLSLRGKRGCVREREREAKWKGPQTARAGLSLLLMKALCL